MLKFVRSTSDKGENKESTLERSRKERSATTVCEEVLIGIPVSENFKGSAFKKMYFLSPKQPRKKSGYDSNTPKKD